MEVVPSGRVRNVVLAGHGGSGKTTLTEAMLLATGAVTRAGRVDTANTVSDYDQIEHALGHSVNLSLLALEHRDHRVNVLDAPGHADLVGELVSGMAGADAAVIVVNAAAGIQAGTEIAWERADEAGVIPRLFVVTHLDREKTDFAEIVEELRERFGPTVTAAALAVDDGGDVLDLVHAEPAALQGEAAEARDRLIELAAESSDELLSRYVDGEAVASDLLIPAARAAIAAGALRPVLPASALTGGGIDGLLDDLVDLLDAPRAAAEGASESGPVVARVIKTIVDPFAGHLSIVKVLSGTLTPGMQLANGRGDAGERVAHVFALRGHEQLDVPHLVTGDIGAVPKLMHAATGDTLTADGAATLPPLPFPMPTYRSAILSESADEADKLSTALARLHEQDPTCAVERDADTAETVLRTIGPAQADLIVERLRKIYGVTVQLGAPRVPYRETIAGTAEREYRHKKQTGGRGQFGHVILRVEPLAPGGGFEFAEQVTGGSVPRQFIPAVEAGVVEALASGPLSGSRVVDVKVTLLGGSYHPVDSNEISFKTAAAHAFKEALLAADPQLLEPVMHLSLRAPSERVGDVMGDLASRRGTARSIDAQGDVSVIDAIAPLVEVQRYAPELSALSGGRGACTMSPDHYAPVPPQGREQAIAGHQARA